MKHRPLYAYWEIHLAEGYTVGHINFYQHSKPYRITNTQDYGMFNKYSDTNAILLF